MITIGLASVSRRSSSKVVGRQVKSSVIKKEGGTMATFTLFGDIKRISRATRMESEGVTTVFGDVKIDFTRAPLEPGDHNFSLFTVFGDVKLRFPEHIGVEIEGFTLFSDVEVETTATGEEEQPGSNWTSDNYTQAQVRVRIQTFALFGDIEIVRVAVPLNAQVGATQLIDANVYAGPEHGYEGETSRLRRDR
jgi:predicted membrane protein